MSHTHMQTIEREFEHWTAQQHAKNNNNEEDRDIGREEGDQQEHARNYKKK